MGQGAQGERPGEPPDRVPADNDAGVMLLVDRLQPRGDIDRVADQGIGASVRAADVGNNQGVAKSKAAQRSLPMAVILCACP